MTRHIRTTRHMGRPLPRRATRPGCAVLKYASSSRQRSVDPGRPASAPGGTTGVGVRRLRRITLIDSGRPTGRG